MLAVSAETGPGGVRDLILSSYISKDIEKRIRRWIHSAADRTILAYVWGRGGSGLRAVMRRGTENVPSKENIMSGSMRKGFFAALAGAALSLGAGNASADIVYQLAVENGNIFGTGPFGSVTVHLVDSDDAIVTFNADSPFLFMDGAGAAVNVNATSFTVASSSVTPLSSTFGQNPCNTPGVCAINIGANQQVDGFGKFNLTLNLQDGSGAAISAAQTQISFDIHNTSGTWASASDVLISNKTTGGTTVAAHMVNPANTNCTGFAGNAGGAGLTSGTDSSGTGGQDCTHPLPEVPIPAAAWLFGSGLLGLIAVARRRIGGKLPVSNLSPVAA